MGKGPKRLRGFTLTELLVTLVVLMVLVVAVGRIISGRAPYEEPRDAAYQVVDLLTYARTIAMSSSKAVMVRIRGISNTYSSGLKRDVTVYQNDDNLCHIPTNNKILRYLDIGGNFPSTLIFRVIIDGSRVTDDHTWLCYKPDGSLRYQDGSSIISSGEIQFRYFVPKSGKAAGPLLRVLLFPYTDARFFKVRKHT